MPSGGARARSGPAPDPGALRRDRKDDKQWTTLPSEGRPGRVPALPLPAATRLEREYWAELWKKPQAVQWDAMHMQRQVAAYVRAYIDSLQPGATAGIKTAVLRMEAELGLSIVGMNALRWRIAVDEIGERRASRSSTSTKPSAARVPSVQERLQAIADGA